MGKATDNRRPSTIIRDNHVHEIYLQVVSELGNLKNAVAKSYIYDIIHERTGLCIKTSLIYSIIRDIKNNRLFPITTKGLLVCEKSFLFYRKQTFCKAVIYCHLCNVSNSAGTNTKTKLNFMDRTYVFNSDGNSGGARYDINAMLPGMLNRGIDPGVLALMNGNGGFGGQNRNLIYLSL